MQIIKQRAVGDCGVAALAMYAEMSYEDAYVAFSKVEKWRRGKSGTYGREVIAAAKELGLTLTPTRKYDLDDDEGILRVRWNDKPGDGGHWVAVRKGLIFCPSDGASGVLEWRDYLERYNGRPCTLLKGTV